MFRIGFDIGSTTAKMVVLDENGNIVFSKYERHNAKVKETVISFLKELLSQVGDEEISIRITGSIGMGVSEKCAISFVQEVVAAAKAIQKDHPAMASMIDIGGEDAKVVFFKDGEPTDLRMNGNCAGGTGAFIDQMAIILGVDVNELNALAMHADQVYPIASRCGVFCKTDIQNLIAKNVSRENIAASIFHAVAVQTVITLAHGYDIKVPVLFCGGPLTFIPALRKAFINYLSLDEKDVILPDHGTLLPALGTALSNTDQDECYKLSHLLEKIDKSLGTSSHASTDLKAIFENETEYTAWKNRMAGNKIKKAEMKAGEQDVFIGIDSGSTTTKIVVIDTDSRLLYSYYNNNGGNAIKTVEEGLNELYETCRKRGAILHIKGSCSTGYGEDLIKSAFQLHSGIIETIAHYMAAQYLDKQVSFILDIGGQDMKAIFVNKGVIDRIEINEACSSGCGSFIETFARSLGYTVSDFSLAACRSSVPSNLGTRCTVFMNSSVKQAQKDGASVEDISAGLSSSIIKNAVYKVIRAKSIDELGKNIVVQGGTFLNDAVLRSFEMELGRNVIRPAIAGLMGAFGCALFAKEKSQGRDGKSGVLTKAQLEEFAYNSRAVQCGGCGAHCNLTIIRFNDGRRFTSGNRCEKGAGIKITDRTENMIEYKYNKILSYADNKPAKPIAKVGLPLALSYYDLMPFFSTLLTSLGFEVVLSEESTRDTYYKGQQTIPSDTVCYPAKLCHGHIESLLDKGVDFIFYPCMSYNADEGQSDNHYNCPVVAYYPELLKANNDKLNDDNFIMPYLDINIKKHVAKAMARALSKYNITAKQVLGVLNKAYSEQVRYHRDIEAKAQEIIAEARAKGQKIIVLAGRPYHIDPEINHGIHKLIASLGFAVITEDSVAMKVDTPALDVLNQWTYHSRLYRAAEYVCENDDMQLVQLVSFGCGIDAVTTDEVRAILEEKGKLYTQLKIDEITNLGAAKIRLRSLAAALEEKEASANAEKKMDKEAM